MVKNPGPLHPQKFSAPNNEMRIESQNHRIVKAGKSSEIIDSKHYVNPDCNLLLMNAVLRPLVLQTEEYEQ